MYRHSHPCRPAHSPLLGRHVRAQHTETGIVKPADEKACVESVDFMRANHMRLLNEWRDEALRNEHRVYVSSDGRKFVISLQNTCLKCHSNSSQF